MLHFPCPKCGGKVETAEPDTISYGNRHLKHYAHGVAGHGHPILSLISTAITVGNFVYQRAPGGGAKRCTVCDHRFN